MRRAWRRWVIIPATLLAGAAAAGGPALAGGDAGSWEGGAYYFSTRNDITTGIQNVPGAGVRAGYYFTGMNELELEYDKGKADGIRNGLSYDQSKLTALYIHNWHPKGHDKMSPMLLVGAGQIFVDDGTRTDHDWLLRAGGGLKLFFSPRVAMRLDAAGFSWYGDGKVAPLTRFFGFDLQLGVSIFVGGAK